MSDKKEPTDIEVPDAPVSDTPAAPSLSDLAKAGFAPGELKMAEKHGLVAKKEDDDAGDKGDIDSSDTDKEGDVTSLNDDDANRRGADDPGGDNGKKEDKKTQKTVDERYRILAEGRSPEAIMEELQDKGIELSSEQEQIFISGLTHNGKTLYWAQKKARSRAQKAEASDSATKKELEKANARIAELEKQRVKKDSNDDPLDLGDAGDGDPQDQDPKKKPLTLEDLDRIEAAKVAKAEEERNNQESRSLEIHDALEDQHAEAKERYADFDHSMELVGDILGRAKAGTLAEIYPDARTQTRIIMKARQLLTAFANADKFESTQFNAADMAYELGKEHPKFGKTKSDAGGEEPGETDVDGNPEDVRRAVTNASRRGSSATLNGGGSRHVALDELTIEQARRLSDAQYRKLPKHVRERLLAS